MGHRLLLICLAALCLQAAPPPFTKAGKGPGVLLIHGFGGNKEVWTEVAADLARDHTVLSVDLPGSGGSPGPAEVAGRADLATVAKGLAGLVRQEGLVPCLVVGHSMGGPIGARAILEDATAFRGLLLVDSFLSALPTAYMEPTAATMGQDPGMALGIFLGLMTSSQEQTKRVVAEALRIPPTALQAYLRGRCLDPLGGRHAQLRLPVLDLSSAPEDPDPAQKAAFLAQHGFKELPKFQVIHGPGTRHWGMWDAPKAFLSALRTFEAGLGR